MSISNIFGKLDGKALIEPYGVIKKHRKIGLHPSSPVPDGAIIFYDSALWQWISGRSDRIKCDGWLSGFYLIPYKDSRILVSKAVGFFASTVVMTL
jgi:hypothetical protein